MLRTVLPPIKAFENFLQYSACHVFYTPSIILDCADPRLKSTKELRIVRRFKIRMMNFARDKRVVPRSGALGRHQLMDSLAYESE